MAEHTHLAYAATGYGVQGVTVRRSHTVLSEAMDAAGVYVGLTRGREANVLHLVAADADDAREQFTNALTRDRADRGLEKATQKAAAAVAGLTDNGPVRFVNGERARLTQFIEQAEQHAHALERALAELSRLGQEQHAEAESQQSIVTAAEARAEQTRAEIVAPLIREAADDGAAFLAARERMWAASETRRNSRGLRGRSAARALARASEEAQNVEQIVRHRWGGLPQTRRGVPVWAQDVTHQAAETDPMVIDALEQLAKARTARQDLATRQARERVALRRQLLGDHAPSAIGATVLRLRQQSEAARTELARIEALPTDEAVEFIQARTEQEQALREAAKQARAERQARAGATLEPPRQSPGAPERGLGR